MWRAALGSFQFMVFSMALRKGVDVYVDFFCVAILRYIFLAENLKSFSRILLLFHAKVFPSSFVIVYQASFLCCEKKEQREIHDASLC